MSGRHGRTDIRHVERVAAADPLIAAILKAGLEDHKGTVDILQEIIVKLHEQKTEQEEVIRYAKDRLVEIRETLKGMAATP